MKLKHLIYCGLSLIFTTPSIFPQNPEWINYFSGNSIKAIAEEGNDLWVGTLGGGLVQVDKISGNFQIYYTNNSSMPDNNVNSICVEDEGIRWFATDNGLVKLDGLNWNIYNVSSSGLPSNSIKTIAIDNFGNKWIGAYHGGLISTMEQIGLSIIR